MKKRHWTTVLLALVLLPIGAHACSLAPGYFHQVIALHGRVVGKNLGPCDLRRLGQSFSIRNVTLIVYQYSWPAKIQDLRQIAKVQTDSGGNFDLGRAAPGHYSLIIEFPNSDMLGGWFDVEITDKVTPADSVLLDVSPIHPDCTGGNEFIEKKVKNAASY